MWTGTVQGEVRPKNKNDQKSDKNRGEINPSDRKKC